MLVGAPQLRVFAVEGIIVHNVRSTRQTRFMYIFTQFACENTWEMSLRNLPLDLHEVSAVEGIRFGVRIPEGVLRIPET